MRKINQPYHVQAHELGADIRTIKTLAHNASATEIRAVWDYRKAGLAVDQAREKIAAWTKCSYHPTPYVVPRGRIINLKRHTNDVREAYSEQLRRLTQLHGGVPNWSITRVRWEISGRTIVTAYHEDVTWPSGYSNRSRWPESKTVTYTSHLLRVDNETLPLRTILGLHLCPYSNMLDAMSETTITHALRGNWRQQVLNVLLPGTTYTPPPDTVYKAVAVVDGEYRSIFDGSPYVIGERRNGTAKPDHEGGYYAYCKTYEARNASVPRKSVHFDAPRVILECEAGGRVITYGDGKRAYSWIRPVAVVN